MQGYDEERQGTFLRELLERAQSIPGVEAVATAGSVPMGNVRFYAEVHPEPAPGAPAADKLPRPPAGLQNSVSPGYFQTIRLPLVRGRDFTERDDAGAPPVVIVSEALAEKFWP